MMLGNVRAVHGIMALALCAATAIACGSGDGQGSAPAAPSGQSTGDDGGTTPSFGDGGGGNGFTAKTLASISIDPPSASIASVDGAPITQKMTLLGHYTDGTSGPVPMSVSWTAGVPQVGSIASTGMFTASGSIGGVVPITAAYQGQTAQATLTVKLQLHDVPTTVPPATVTALNGATTKDASVTWAYPYDGTVFPRGLAAPVLMWNGGGASDVIGVHVQSSTFELLSYAPAVAPGAYTFNPTIWQRMVDSSSGKSTLTVTRFDGTSATIIALNTMSIAPASMRGTIYYWAQNIGRVVRIKPGASAPDDFANAPPLNNTSTYPASSCLMTCHTVSANGSTIISGGGSFGGSYNLATGQPLHSLGGVWGGANGENDGSVIQWSNSALTPDGQYVVQNRLAEQLVSTVAGAGMYKASDGTEVATSGIPSDPTFMPAFSPDATKLVYVAGATTAPSHSWIESAAPGALRVMDFNETGSPMLSNARDLVQPAAAPYGNITWPTVSPDGHWALYARLNSTIIDSRGDCSSGTCNYGTLGDMYLADTTKPNSEVRLAALDGDSYPFAAGTRDLHYNYEPTFAPVAAGGYFWVVFTSRRTYGNALTGGVNVTKQLWVAAIDQNPQPGVDPSHPAFLLPGQDETTLNLRGFWALDPCKGDGQGCASGTECCGGYCNGSGDGGAMACTSTSAGCSADGDKCNTAADCCGAAMGTSCINHVCSEATPK